VAVKPDSFAVGKVDNLKMEKKQKEDNDIESTEEEEKSDDDIFTEDETMKIKQFKKSKKIIDSLINSIVAEFISENLDFIKDYLTF